jgi:hypothetical protein
VREGGVDSVAFVVLMLLGSRREDHHDSHHGFTDPSPEQNDLFRHSIALLCVGGRIAREYHPGQPGLRSSPSHALVEDVSSNCAREVGFQVIWLPATNGLSL